jgi:hypothetical protein
VFLRAYFKGRDQREREEEIRKAEMWYREALRMLEEEPDSPERRKIALTTGREYARMVRESSGESLFDELALMNDINVIAGQQVASPTTRKAPQPLSYEERLARLQRLAAEGHLTKDEYVEARKRLLSEL